MVVILPKFIYKFNTILMLGGLFFLVEIDKQADPQMYMKI